MNWSSVGDYLKNNIGSGTALVGSLLTGNIPGAIAAGASLVSSATGTDDPIKAMEQLQTNPEAMIRLKELALQNEASIREHIRQLEEMKIKNMELIFKDAQEAHRTQQETIQEGDKADDPYVRQTRPVMARQAWYGTMVYILGMEVAKAFGYGNGASWDLASILMTPSLAYMGARTIDKAGGIANLSGITDMVSLIKKK